MNITHNLNFFIKEFEETCKKAKRNPQGIKIIGATKGQSIESINAAISSGISNFGENFVQEAEKKMDFVNPNAQWHFIGSIQSRKTKKIASLFQWVHSVDRVKIAQNLNKHRPIDKGALNICIQINIDNEPSKSGIMVKDTKNFILELQNYEMLKIRGLMSIPKPHSDLSKQRKGYKKIKNHFNELKKTFPFLDTLSMGMSRDYKAAIIEGSTMVRIGTRIFGPRE
tara:strand:- start:1564 stop:2241 length:678 start_codon:yes stop_codon:yes gene_type:complete